jgi:hypothetical protein
MMKETRKRTGLVPDHYNNEKQSRTHILFFLKSSGADRKNTRQLSESCWHA